jgi:hypothetical protein
MNYFDMAMLAACLVFVIAYWRKHSKEKSPGYFNDQYDPHFQDNFRDFWNNF